MKEKNFDIRKLFKNNKFIRQEDVFDEVEQKIEGEKMKKRLKQNLKNLNKQNIIFKKKADNNEPVEKNLKETKEESFKIILNDFKNNSNCCNFDFLRSQINDFNFDDSCVYDFGNNQIKKIAKIEEYDLVKKITKTEEYDYSDKSNNLFNILSHSQNIFSNNFLTLHNTLSHSNILFHSQTLCDYDKLVFLESKIYIKDKEITKEIFRTLIELEGVEGMGDVCFRCYENLIENGLLIEELFYYKRDIRVLDKLNRTEFLSDEYILEYLIFLNKSIEIKTQCNCLSCVVCKLISPLKYQEIVDKCNNSFFYKPENMKKLTLDEILKLKFELIDKIKINNNLHNVHTFHHILFGFPDTKLEELITKQKKMNVYTCAICLIIKNKKIEKFDDIEIVLESYDKVQYLLNIEMVEHKSLVEQIDFHYKKFDELNFDFFKLEMSLKELVRVFKMKSNVTTFSANQIIIDNLYVNNLHSNTLSHFTNTPTENLYVTNLFLPYNSIFILKSIFKHKSRPKYLIYEIYEKLSKFIVPFFFYEELFNNQNDFTLHFIRAKELFKFNQLTNEKIYLVKCLKYIDKKTNEIKFKDKIYKFKLLKAKILTNINLCSEAYNEIQGYNNIDKFKNNNCKILSYSNLTKAIEECKKVKNDYKLILMMIEFKISLKEGLEIGILFKKNSNIDIIIENEFLQHCELYYQIQLSYVRYLKYRDLKRAHEYITNVLKKPSKKVSNKIDTYKIENDKKEYSKKDLNKKNNIYNDFNLYYESFIIKRKLSLVSYRVLYFDRQSDLLNQEIAYLENKDCDNSNPFLYLFLYKKIKKECKGGKDHLNYYLQEVVKGNGDCLVILRILYDFSEEILLLFNLVYQVENGFYWNRTRKIIDFKKRLRHTIEIFEYDQNY